MADSTTPTPPTTPTPRPVDAGDRLRGDLERGGALPRHVRADQAALAVLCTLKGKVHSWFEKEEAKREAWLAPGVREVVDNLEITFS